MGTETCRASSGSQRRSFSTASAYSAALGRRMSMSSPRWNVKLSQPPLHTGAIGSCDHCGNCSATSPRTTSVSTAVRFGTGPRSGTSSAVGSSAELMAGGYRSGHRCGIRLSAIGDVDSRSGRRRHDAAGRRCVTAGAGVRQR